MKLKVQCPAKINLTLKVFKRDDKTGFHPVESIMQTVSLYDFLTVGTTPSGINLAGNSAEIKYDETNLVLRACRAFFRKTGIKTGLNIYIEKNIPVASGLAGGSTDAAGMLLALNTIFKEPLSPDEICEINSSLGSDINFCYTGGRALARGKGDNLTLLSFEKFSLLIVKPRNLKISTKEAYEAYDTLKVPSNLPNDLEFAMRPRYKELRDLAALGFSMSGSGPSFYMINPNRKISLDLEKYEIYKNLKSIQNGVNIL